MYCAVPPEFDSVRVVAGLEVVSPEIGRGAHSAAPHFSSSSFPYVCWTAVSPFQDGIKRGT